MVTKLYSEQRIVPTLARNTLELNLNNIFKDEIRIDL